MIQVTNVSIIPSTVDTGQVFIISVGVTSKMTWFDVLTGTWDKIKQATWGAVKGD